MSETTFTTFSQTPVSGFSASSWLSNATCRPDPDAADAARKRQEQLTKPPGALGRLEALAIQFAGWQATPLPAIDSVHIAVFAADHGVAAEGVSAFPQAVTAEMVRNFARGGAAINVLARTLEATLEVIDLGTVVPIGTLPGVRDERIAPESGNIAVAPAMNEEQFARALASGRAAVLRAKARGVELFIGGEMGIGNTTAASALSCVLLDLAPELLAGPGTGLSAGGVAHKAAVIGRALALHRRQCPDLREQPRESLRRLSGFEIAALAGAFIACAQEGIPALVDGFIATAAVLAAVRINPGVRDWLMFAHRSQEPGHECLLSTLDASPLIALEMRLGEGSGAATAVPLLRLACTLHREMATFSEAGISGAAG